MKGKIIVIDGMDGTGKATQSKLLYEDLKNRGMKVKLFSFPNYESDSSYFVKKFLKEGYTRDIDDPMLHSSYFSIDRAITYAHEIKEYYENGYIIILDRYIISNVVCNLHRYTTRSDKYHYVVDLSKLENDILNLPKADMNIILYSSPEINNKLMENRCDTEDTERDLNETIEVQKKFYSSVEHLNSERKEFKYHLGDIYVLKIHNDRVVFSEKSMHYSIMKLINDELQLYLDIE